MEQDPRFAFRIIVDIANKALSPAINDPTTAVLALDQLHRLLMHVGKRRLDDGPGPRCPGALAFLLQDAGLGGFRQPGRHGDSPFRGRQLAGGPPAAGDARTLCCASCPKRATRRCKQELNLLQCATQRLFPDDEDRASAAVGDLQGIGGSESS